MANAPKKPKPESVSVSSKLREAHPWFEEKSQKAKDAAVAARRKKLRLEGKQLSPQRLVEISDALEKIQRELNPLEIERDKLLLELKPHWGHTGIAEIEGTLGKTLLSLSFQYAIEDPLKVQAKVTEGRWLSITKRALDAKAALGMAENDETLRTILGDNAKVKVTLTVTPPSSRRPKSGEPQDEEE